MSSLKHSLPEPPSQTQFVSVSLPHDFGECLLGLKMLLHAVESGFLLSCMVVNDLNLEL